mgnify:CR=1 FL=1
MIIQHPSTPEDMKNPRELVDQCMAEFFPYVIEIMMDYGVDVEDLTFQKDFRLLVEFSRALLLKHRGVHHELQAVFEETLNINDE